MKTPHNTIDGTYSPQGAYAYATVVLNVSGPAYAADLCDELAANLRALADRIEDQGLLGEVFDSLGNLAGFAELTTREGEDTF